MEHHAQMKQKMTNRVNFTDMTVEQRKEYWEYYKNLLKNEKGIPEKTISTCQNSTIE
jgi:hypothetical protein